MKGDFTRDTFHESKRYNRVRMQQGRVQLDADWNEQADIEAHLRETGVRDVVGPSGAPMDGGGFQIEATLDGSHLVISPGRLWVDGILCELSGATVPLLGVSVPVSSPPSGGFGWDVQSAAPMQQAAAVVARQSAPVSDLLPIPIPLPDPVPAPVPVPMPETFSVVLSDAGFDDLGIARAGGDLVKLFYIDDTNQENELGPFLVQRTESLPSGVRVTLLGSAFPVPGASRLRRDTDYLRQPDFPGAAYPTQDGAYLAYLDVWSRHLTWLDDPEIREIALGGPDTGTRLKTVCQVRLLPIGTAGETDFSGNLLNCQSKPDLWSGLTAPPSGRMRARAVPETAASDPCIVPAGSGFTGLENQLYRVEIHEGSNPADSTFIPTFKWSRDNGSIVTRWVDALTSGQVRVADPGRDSVLGFHQNDWVELIKDGAEADGRQAGELVKIDSIVDDLLTFTPVTEKITAWIQAFQAVHQSQSAPPPPAIKMRRWDMLPASPGARPVKAGTSDPADGFLPLENGVQVRFEEGTYKAGDYWLIPARTFIGAFAPGIEWPGDPGSPLALPPHGIEHHYCKLAVVELSGGVWSVRGDCRNLFPPLTELIELFYVSGDGQEVAPDFGDPTKTVPLPQPLVVGVSNGGLPVQGARVRFTVTLGNGILTGGGQTFDSPGTDAQGLASCVWQLDSTTLSQQVLAELLDAAGNRRHLPVLFTASLSQASCCCTVEIGDGVKSHGDFDDLQEALTQLAKRVPAEIPVVLCLLRGTHRPPKTVVVSRDRVTIRGCGRATHVIAPAGRPAFQLAAKLGALEGIYLTVEDDAGAPAVLCNGSWNRVEGNEVVTRLGPAIWSTKAFNLTVAGNRLSGAVPTTTTTTTTTTSTTTTSTDSATARAAAAPGGADASAVIVLKSRLDVTALVILDGGTRFARVTGNLIGPGACHGIGLTLSTLWDVVIAGNEIQGLGGSGIASINVPPVVIPGDSSSQHFDEAAVAGAILADRQLTQRFNTEVVVTFVPTPARVDHLRIERNSISGNALGTRAPAAGSPPLGGIVLSRLLHVQITGNRIESNGRGQTREPVAGIFIDDCKGLIVRDNVVVDNGPEPNGQTLSGPQGGILATTLTVVVDSVKLGTAGAATITQPDGWPAAAVQENLVVAPRGLALVLTGMGPMQVTGNRFTARDLLAVVPGVSPQLENYLGAVLISNLGMAGYLYPQIAAGGLRTQSVQAPVNGTPPTGDDWTVGGKVEFSDNQVSFDFTRGANQTAIAAVGLFTLDDLGLHDNQTECRLLADTLIADTLAVASTVRANGNGFTESMQGVSFSLWSNGLAMSTAVGNQGTHCIVIHGPAGRVRDDDNLAWFCRKDVGQVSFNQAQTDTQTTLF